MWGSTRVERWGGGRGRTAGDKLGSEVNVRASVELRATSPWRASIDL